MLTLPYKPCSLWAHTLNRCMVPFMALAAIGTNNQRLQETHYWNNRSIDEEQIDALRADLDLLAHVPGGDYQTSPGARMRRRVSTVWPFSHVYVLGGWHRYVVLTRPTHRPGDEWRLGWVNRRAQGVSLLALNDRHVLCLQGPEDTVYFALKRVTHNGADVLEQVALVVTDYGVLGDSRHDHIRLL